MAKFVPQEEMSLLDQVKIRREKLEQLQQEGKNPFENTTLPKVKKTPRAIWDSKTIRRALDECKDSRLYVAMNLSFACSLRIGEIVGLTWDNVHITDEDISNDNAWVYVDKELERVSMRALKALI